MKSEILEQIARVHGRRFVPCGLRVHYETTQDPTRVRESVCAGRGWVSFIDSVEHVDGPWATDRRVVAAEVALDPNTGLTVGWDGDSWHLTTITEIPGTDHLAVDVRHVTDRAPTGPGRLVYRVYWGAVADRGLSVLQPRAARWVGFVEQEDGE